MVIPLLALLLATIIGFFGGSAAFGPAPDQTGQPSATATVAR